MTYFYAFVLAGLVCLLGQIILDNTSLTAGHITSLFTVLGAVLSFFGLYDKLIEKCGAGASILITNFGHMLFSSGMEGYASKGIMGIFSFLLNKSSLAIVAAIILSFIFALIFEAKD